MNTENTDWRNEIEKKWNFMTGAELISYIESLLKEQREIPEIMEYLKIIENSDRTATGTTEKAFFIIDSSGYCRLTRSLSGTKPAQIAFDDIKQLYFYLDAFLRETNKILNAPEPSGVKK